MKKKVAEIFNLVFGFRKVIIMLILFLIGVIFRSKGLISGSEMVDLLKSTSIAFIGANSVEHIMTTVKSYVDAKNANQENLPADTNEKDDEEEVTVPG